MTFRAISPIRIFKSIFSFSLQNIPTNWAISIAIFNILFHRTILWVYSSSIFYNLIYVYTVYIYIFWNFVKFCSLFATLLTKSPALPATNLAEDCYGNMFWNCTSLVIPPDLPATNLVQDCYAFLFYGCKKLNSIKIGYTGDYDSIYFNSWVSGVANSGTFYYNGITQTAEDFGLNGWTKHSF